MRRMKRIAFAGRHVRPFMENACYHGYEVAALDGFNDWDAARFGLLLQPFGGMGQNPEGFFSRAEALPGWPLIFCSPVESCPQAMQKFSGGRQALNASASAMASSRDFAFLSHVAGGLVLLPEVSAGPGNGEPGWIVKQTASAGGMGIRMDGGILNPGEFRQKLVTGLSVGAVFYSCATGTRLCGLTRHINHGFLFAGGIYPADIGQKAHDAIRRFAQKLAPEAGMRGWWGADFIINGDTVHLLEVNPRFTASLELLALAHEIDIVGVQAGMVDGTYHLEIGKAGGYFGRMVVYAAHDCVFAGPEKWFDAGARDIPHHGAAIKNGEPVLSLYATGGTQGECMEKLRAMENGLNKELYGP